MGNKSSVVDANHNFDQKEFDSCSATDVLGKKMIIKSNIAYDSSNNSEFGRLTIKYKNSVTLTIDTEKLAAPSGTHVISNDKMSVYIDYKLNHTITRKIYKNTDDKLPVYYLKVNDIVIFILLHNFSFSPDADWCPKIV